MNGYSVGISWSLFGVLCAGFGCSESLQVPPPDPPSLEALVNTFEAPSGHLDEDTGPRLVERVASTVEDLEQLQVLGGFLEELLASISGTQESTSALRQTSTDRFSTLGTQVRALEVSGGAWGRMTYTCGPDDDINAKRHGQVVLNVLYDSDIVWGEASDCFVPNTDQPTVVNGPLALYLPSLESGEYLTDLDLTYRVGENEREFDLGFRYSQDTFSVIQELDGATFVIAVGSDPTDTLGIRDACGDWSCELSQTRCRFASATGDCDTLEQEVTW